jgi:hypothetical protein
MAERAKFRVVGWIGFSDDKPFFEQVRDAYSDDLFLRAELFKSFRAARQRFEKVERVVIDGPRPRARSRKENRGG